MKDKYNISAKPWRLTTRENSWKHTSLFTHFTPFDLNILSSLVVVVQKQFDVVPVQTSQERSKVGKENKKVYWKKVIKGKTAMKSLDSTIHLKYYEIF